MKTVSLATILKAADCDRDLVVSWQRRDLLRTEFEPTQPGVARGFTRDNAREIMLMAAMTNVGVDPSIASTFIDKWLRDVDRGTLAGWWIANPRKLKDYRLAGHVEFGDKSAESRLVSLMGMMADEDAGGWEGDPRSMAETVTAGSLVVVHVAEVIRRADALFGEDA
jgi:hypothetical protein